MNYKSIVAEAWQFTQDNRKIVIWYGALPSIFTTIIGIWYIIYQYFAFVSSPLFENWNDSFLYLVFTLVLDFLKTHHSIFLPLLITSAILLVCYFFVPVILEGGLIQLIARKKNGQTVPNRKGINYGLLYFLPLFEYKLLVKTFGVTSVFSLVSTALRSFGWSILPAVLPIGIFALLIILILAVFFTYTGFYIVIDEEGTFSSISKSFILVARNLEETILLTILMLIIGLRIILQIFFVLLIPTLVVGVVYLLAMANLPDLGFALGGGIGFVGLILASYLNGIVHVFAITVWTLTFLHLTSETAPHARNKSEKQSDI